MNECAFIIFGASGDLAKRKLFPALYHLFINNKINNFAIIGVAYDDVSIDSILDNSKKYIKEDVDQAAWLEFKKRVFYHQLNFSQAKDYDAVHRFVSDIEKQFALSGNRLLYLACAARFFCEITSHTAQSGLAKRLTGNEPIWNRIVYEKPFGHDAKSAHEINECIKKSFNEIQIYRIDHYLTKELVSNIVLIRFANLVFEPLWNNRYIDSVQIILDEEIGLEGRGEYYDSYGALCDVVQNHMLELMALIAMEAPEKLTGEFIRDERAKALQKIRFVDVLLGQYEGYKEEKGVSKDSKMDTFAAIYLKIDNPRWAGVPFYLKTGKFLKKKETVIHIKFKKVDCLLIKNCPNESNYLTIRLYPDESFIVTLNVKKPDSQELVPIAMEYCHSCLFGVKMTSAYEVLIDEIMRGEQSVSVRFDEIEYAWKLIDAIKAERWPLCYYQKGSKGPQEVEEFAKKHGIRWRS